LQSGKEGMEQNFNEENKFMLLQYIIEAFIGSNRLKEVPTCILFLGHLVHPVIHHPAVHQQTD
jgi:hypothetical protein